MQFCQPKLIQSVLVYLSQVWRTLDIVRVVRLHWHCIAVDDPSVEKVGGAQYKSGSHWQKVGHTDRKGDHKKYGTFTCTAKQHGDIPFPRHRSASIVLHCHCLELVITHYAAIMFSWELDKIRKRRPSMKWQRHCLEKKHKLVNNSIWIKVVTITGYIAWIQSAARDRKIW